MVLYVQLALASGTPECFAFCPSANLVFFRFFETYISLGEIIDFLPKHFYEKAHISRNNFAEVAKLIK
jgi:hypothetical protein